jgi:Pvc16 N-terminal domain/Carboxypeptidase regulatory-like domain
VFQDLDATLQAMLGDAGAPNDLRAADVSFVTPDKDFKPTQPTINLYLHDITENRALRDGARVMEHPATTWVSRLPSMRVDCTYLVTAWSADTAGVKVAAEHRLLGLALAWFARFPELPAQFLQGTLKTPPQAYPIVSIVAQAREGQESGQFWSALGTPPRPGFSVTVTVSVEPFDQVEQYADVQRIDVFTALAGSPALGGRVLDHSLNAVSLAEVSAVGTGATVSTDTTGRYTLPGLNFGTYTLRVHRFGAADVDVPADFAADNQFHVLVLPAP